MIPLPTIEVCVASYKGDVFPRGHLEVAARNLIKLMGTTGTCVRHEKLGELMEMMLNGRPDAEVKFALTGKLP